MKADYSRILLILLLPIGDTLFTTPAIRTLRRRFPNAYIAGLVYSTNQAILEANPDIDEVFTYPTLQSGTGILGLPALLLALRKHRFELAVEMSTFSFWLSRIAFGIPDRLHLRFPRLWWLLPGRDPSWRMVHAAHHYSTAVSSLTGSVEDLQPRMIVSASEREYSAGLLWEEGIQDTDTLIAMHPGGQGFGGRKRWRAANFAFVADALIERLGAKMIILGGANELEIAREVETRMAHEAVNLAGKTTLKQTAAVLKRCDLFIGNDSSPLHIAAAIGTPAVGVYGPSNINNFHPIGPKSVTVIASNECQPCFNFVGSNPLWQFSMCRSCRCLDRISPKEVFAAAVQAIRPRQARSERLGEPNRA